MSYFHYRCGERITLINDYCTAIRSDGDFDHGIVITAEPLANDVLFEIKIDKKVNSWSGSIEFGVTECDPLHLELPPCASRLTNGSWIMASQSILKDGGLLVDRYGSDLGKLSQDDRVGVMRTSDGELVFYINGESQGVAAENLPPVLYGVVDLYGKCVQVTITSPPAREHNNDDCLSGSSVLAIDNDILNVTLGGDLSELSMSSSNSLDIRMDMNVSLSLPEEYPRNDKLRFHERCGSLVKLSNGQRTAERRRPLDEFNNGVVMTHRPLRDSELFEIRIDRLVDKWSGSIEMGVTTHNPTSLVFPATMTNMRSGTIMMSGCGILTNGKGTRREYGNFNLDELSEGDRVGMMRKPDGNLHYFINGLDQGVAAQKVPNLVWGVIDLYGMTIKVSIVERDEREEQNLMTRRITRDQQMAPVEPHSLPAFYDRLTFHSNCGTHAQVINNGRTAHRPNAADDFNNGVVLTARPLKPGEMFEVRLDRVVTKWAGSIEIGVTTHSPTDLEFPFTMTNVRSGTWMMTGSGVMHNGTIVLEQYGVNLDRLQVSDRVGVVRKENGLLHFFVNGVDQGTAASNVAEKVYGVIDLYGQAVEATIVDMFDYASPDTINSSLSNTTLYSDLRFHHVHGKNARIVNNGLTALRPRPLAEFNDGIVFSSRPLRDGELFEVTLDTMVDRWSGSVELGVTAVRPDDLDLPSTATDLARDTWMLSGSSIMENGTTLKSNYPCDLDVLTAGTRIGVMRSSDRAVEFYKDSVPQGVACFVGHQTIYAVVDLYGQCAQVSIPCATPCAPLISSAPLLLENSLQRSDTSQTSLAPASQPSDHHRFSSFHSKTISLTESGRMAVRLRDAHHGLVFSASSLAPDEPFEVSLCALSPHLAGTLCFGVTSTSPSASENQIPQDACYLTGNELRYKNRVLQHFTPSFCWLRVGDRVSFLRTHDGTLKAAVNGEDLSLLFPALSLSDRLYVVVDLRGTCSGVAVASRNKALSSPLGNVRLQDSLEIVLEQEQSGSEAAFAGEEVAVVPSGGFGQYEFHENHGRNVEIGADRRVAKRVASYNQGLVIVQPVLQPNRLLKVVVEKLDGRWQSSLNVGFVCGPPERINLPVTALSVKGPSCVITNDWLSVNGLKTPSSYGQKLSSLQEGSQVGLLLAEDHVQLLVDGVAEEALSWNVPLHSQCYAVFDLYGQCQQIRILHDNEEQSAAAGQDCEKADLESREKESSETNLTLSLPTTSSNAPVLTISKNSPVTPLKMLPCYYKQECEKLKTMLFLPSEYFTQDEPVCYCFDCLKFKARASEGEETLSGWVKFSLKNFSNLPTDKWHTAFYSSKLCMVRCILDDGQPLTKQQMEYSNLIGRKADDVQVLFSPALSNCVVYPFQLDNGKKAFAALQLLIKPGAYSVASHFPEWSTKETGAIALHSLLLRIVDC